MGVPGAPPPVLPALTSARFFAALVVVLHHYVVFLPYPSWLAQLAAHGQAGVCFFFILSGFILAYNYHGWFAGGVSRESRWAFYRARFARVYPMHLVTLLAATPITLAIHGALGAGPHPSWKFFSVTWLAHLGLLQAWVPVPLIQYQWNSPSWSISAEFLFYLVFPYVIAAVAARGRGPGQLLGWAAGVWGLEAVAVVLVGLVALGASPWPVTEGYGELHWIVSTWAPLRLGEFLVGCLLGATFIREQQAPSPVFAAFREERWRNVLLVGAAAAAYALCWLPIVGSFGGFVVWTIRNHVLFVPCFAVMILALAHGQTVCSSLLERPTLILLGEASYSLYLLHGLPLLLLVHFIEPTGTTLPLVAIALTIALSVGCYKWLETPARRWLRGPGRAPLAREAA